MSLLVKICGLTTLEDARFCAGAGADMLGFIQYPGSPRYLPPEDARAIIDWVYGAETVGVFVNDQADAINATCEAAGFTVAQLHGDEPPAVCAAIERPVIKAFRTRPEDTAETLRQRIRPYLPHIAYVLLDAHAPTAWGGTGTRARWDLARALATEVPLLLAGGLDAQNTAEAVQTVDPAGIDLSSGVESAPGRKDFDKLTAFFDVVRALREARETPAP